jgi:hypothetical protein
MVILERAVSMISMRPAPTFEFPSQVYTAPLPFSAPLNVLFIEGSRFSYGDQEFQLWKSLMSENIFPEEAFMIVERSTWNASGFVDAKMSSITTRTPSPAPILGIVYFMEVSLL